MRKVAGFFGERGIRQLFLGDAVKVTASQRPKMNAMWTEVLETLDWPERPELYVTQTPIANAMAVGFDKPFVVVHSGLLEVLDEDELRDGARPRARPHHERPHDVQHDRVHPAVLRPEQPPFLAAAAILPFQLALLEWQRKSEFSSDRAGLLVAQDLNIVMSTEMKLAGGKSYGDQLRVEEFIRQAEQYETGGDAWDTVLKILNTVMRTHPMHTVRAAELLRWSDAGGYDKILAGDYLRRGQSDSRPSAQRRLRGRRRLLRPEDPRDRRLRSRTGSRKRQGRSQLGVAKSMKVLLVGGGGREHALAWRLRQDDPHASNRSPPRAIRASPSWRRAFQSTATDIESLLRARSTESVDWTLVGPEAPLAAGLVDAFRGKRASDLRPDARRPRCSRRRRRFRKR